MRNEKALYALSLAIILLIAPLTYSQCPPLYTFTGDPTYYDGFGEQVAIIGDINDDGYGDFIIAANHKRVNGGDVTGQVYVYSGRTGEILYVFTGEAPGDHFGSSISSAGDFDGDGIVDILVGAYHNDDVAFHSGKAYVFSGQSGALLHTFTGQVELDNLGYSVASAGDVNNDGIDDLIIFSKSKVYVFSGQTGDTIHVFIPEPVGGLFGGQVASAGDVDNDGYDDLIIGAPGTDDSVLGSSTGKAYIISGQTGAIIYSLTGESDFDYFGTSVSSAGDINKDGYNDVIIGAPGYRTTDLPSVGRAYVYSGMDGSNLYTFTGTGFSEELGYRVASAGDIDGDSYDDLLIGTDSWMPNGRAYLISGKTGELIKTYHGTSDNQILGQAISAAGDINNDGIMDVILGDYAYIWPKGQAVVFLSSTLCVGTRGDVNGDGNDANILDLTSLVDFIFRGGTESTCIDEADINSDGTPSNILDLTFLVDFIFRGGPAPGPC
ncbi:MAG: FG-GAP repeat protein [candidate division Zixibacteria bacterium]|nr:FG-GAP repeat protein [candidate division Zixibacteria bacterium]